MDWRFLEIWLEKHFYNGTRYSIAHSFFIGSRYQTILLMLCILAFDCFRVGHERGRGYMTTCGATSVDNIGIITTHSFQRPRCHRNQYISSFSFLHIFTPWSNESVSTFVIRIKLWHNKMAVYWECPGSTAAVHHGTPIVDFMFYIIYASSDIATYRVHFTIRNRHRGQFTP